MKKPALINGRSFCLVKPGCVVVFAMWLCPGAAYAQRDTSKTLKQVTIKAAQQVQQTAVPVQQTGAGEFKQYSAFTAADVARNFAGVNIRDYGGIGGLKTISVRSLGAEHTAVFYDGVQLNDTQNGQIDLGRINLQNIQQIALYNSQPPGLLQPARAFASASILSIVPVHPDLTFQKPYQLTAGIKGGSFGLINPYLQWQQRLSERWSINLNTDLETASGRYKYKVTGTGADTMAIRLNADIKAIQTDAALYWVKSDSNKFSIRFNQHASDQGLPGVVIPYTPVGSQRLWNSDFFTQAAYKRIWENGLQLLLNTKFSSNYERYVDPQFLNEQHKLEQFYRQHEIYQSAAFGKQVTANWAVLLTTDISYTGLSANAYNYAYPTRLTLLNAFATKITFGRWLFQGDLLHTYVNDDVKAGAASPAKNIYSPALDASWKPFGNSNFLLRAFYKDIFRNPTFNDLYYSELGRRDVKPEYANQFDLGSTYTRPFNGFIDFIAITADLYYNHIKDKIVAIPSQNAFIWSIVNYGKVDIRGIDATLKAQTAVINNFKYSVSASYTYQQALNVTDPASQVYNNQIPYTPVQTISINAGISYKSLGLYYNQLTSSHRYYLNQNITDFYLPPYSVSDASVNYSLRLSKMPASISAEVNNLFNKRYEVIHGFPMPGASVRLAIQLTI